MKHCTEDIGRLRFKKSIVSGTPLSKSKPEMRMLWRGDKAVVKNSSGIHESTSGDEKHFAVARLLTRWIVAVEVCPIGWISTQHDIANAVTKMLPESTRKKLFGNWTH